MARFIVAAGLVVAVVAVAPTAATSRVVRNPNMGKLQAGYLFPEIGRRRNAFLAKNPDANIISLGIGDTTRPIPPHILKGLTEGAQKLGTASGYAGYGPEQGVSELRERIAAKLYNGKVDADEVFVSDGSKCDIGRLQMMFGADVVTAVQDPVYPVYVDTSVIMGQTGQKDGDYFPNMVYMPCNPSNDFFPDLTKSPHADIIYFCSPNNPTGATASRSQLQELVDWANERGSIIVFDAA
jgi:LL-diaminopimelate aminotransferase